MRVRYSQSVLGVAMMVGDWGSSEGLQKVRVCRNRIGIVQTGGFAGWVDVCLESARRWPRKKKGKPAATHIKAYCP